MPADFLNTPAKDTTRALRPQRWMAWLALTLGSCLSLLGWHVSKDNAANLTQARFEARSDEVHATIEARLTAYAQVLRGGQTYIGATGHPDRAGLARLHETLRISDNYPGMTGVVYIRYFKHAERIGVEKTIRKDEPDFSIRPAGTRNEYAVVTAVEPHTSTNLPVIGSDSWAHPTRRATLVAARDSGDNRITPKLNLVIDDPASPQPAFLMYQAVYRNGSIPITTEGRRAALLGYIAAGFRIDALMLGMLGKVPSDVALRVHDAAEAGAGTLFHASHPDFDFQQSRYHRTRALEIGGRTWRIDYAALPAFDAETGGQLASGRLLAGGALVSLLLFVIVWSLATTRARAETMARRMTRSLREGETKLRALFEQAPIGVWLLDRDGKLLDCNEKFAEYAGTPRNQIVGRSILAEADDTSLNEAIRRAIAGETVQLESPYRFANSSHVPTFSWHFQPVELDGDLAFVLCFVEDISARKVAEAHIEDLAHHDTLTGLANRALLKDRLQQAISAATRRKTQIAILFIDLDFFKLVNDTVGHSAGDTLLIEMAGRLRHCVRESDTLARIGGDEFVILLTNIRDMQDCIRVAEKSIAAISQPLQIDSHTFNITGSIGIAIWPDDGKDSETLTRNADVAMYHAKKSGRNNYQFFTADMNARALEQAAMERSLREALALDQFCLHFQAQVNGENGSIVGAETLLRWQHPELGLLLPGKFIEIAEGRGLIAPMGRWVLRAACCQMQNWRQAGWPELRVAVNISPIQFRKNHLLTDIADALRESGLPPSLLALEITEGAVMEDVAHASHLLQQIRQLGVTVEIDDFGTGHSSLAYLKQLPIQRLKIDRSFVRDVPGDPDDTAIVEAIISLAGSLKLEIIAEGVETDAQRQFLLAHGCVAMQGYHFSRPLPADEFGALLREAGKTNAIAQKTGV
ncbi:MAG: EAL domain-containing protein [Betaproteobacteria bacterium]|uniref:EAL domain-containing protein n=1 Tax=Candidatus Proximibacter danicus TaxID=2954365 RepID=A0A9D7K495_9PROT|nr:EAL domain-containing protein [Candidatus Proximibacter danicus]